jgi:hypothetical protein
VLHKLLMMMVGLSCAAALAGCGGATDAFAPETKLFSRSLDVFSSKDWGRPPAAAEISLTQKVTPDDFIDANGACGAAAQPAPEPAVGTVAGDLGTTSTTRASTAPPHVTGGIGLGMTECQVVQRAGQPTEINIGAAEGNERKVVLTYTAGKSWPGIYTFLGGRLREVEAVAMPEPVKPVKKKTTKPKTAARS